MKKNRFKLLFAYRNVTSNKKNSLVVILTLSLVFSLLILILGMNHTFSKIYEYEASNIYQNTDIVVTYDEYSTSRLINNRYIEDTFDNQINYSLSFFNIYVLIDDQTSQYYGNLFSSLSHEFEILVDQDVDISQTSTIITESFAKQYGLAIGDMIEFNVLDTRFQYQVEEIFPDTGLFSGVSFYIDKESFYENLYHVSSLSNLGNTLYVNVKSDVDMDQLLSDIKSDAYFSYYNVYRTIDPEYISNKAMDLSSMMLALGLIVLVAIVMVLDSLFPIVNRYYRQYLGVTNTMGGNKSFIWNVNLYHWLIYVLISFVIGSLLSLIVINLGLYVYGLTGYIGIQMWTLGLALVIVLAFIVGRAHLGFLKEQKLSIASQSRNKRYVRYHTHYLLILSAAILMVVEYVFSFLPLEWHAVAIVSLSIYLAMNLSSILLVLLSRLLEKVKHHSLFKLFHLKYLRTNRHIHQSLRVLLISLISLVLIFSVRAFLFSEIESFQNSMTFDLALTNVYDYDIDVLDEIASYGADQSDSATYYQNVTIYFNEDEFQPCTFFVSMEYDSFDIYFDFNGAEVDPQYIDDDLPYVLLPLDFQIVYDLVPGDTVIMDLNYKMEGVEMVVAGFLQTNFDNIIYSDIMLRPQYEDLAKPNTIFFITDKKQALNQDLIQDYSSKMYYVLDPDLYFGEYIHSAENVIDFFTVFSFFMIVCFIIIIFNNTLLVFYGLKSDIAKIKVLGGGATVFLRNLFKEYLLMVVIILMVGLPEIMILSVKLKYVVLLTDYYKNITSTPLTITYGYAIVGIVLILSYLFYFYNIQKAKIVDEIKNI